MCSPLSIFKLPVLIDQVPIVCTIESWCIERFYPLTSRPMTGPTYTIVMRFSFFRISIQCFGWQYVFKRSDIGYYCVDITFTTKGLGHGCHLGLGIFAAKDDA